MAENEPPTRWHAAAIAFGNGWKRPEPFKAFVIGEPGLLFQTAEDVRDLLGLDHTPTVVETVDLPLYDDREHGDPVKYCQVPLGSYLDLRDTADFGEQRYVDVNGNEFVIHVPLKLLKKFPKPKKTTTTTTTTTPPPGRAHA